MAIGAITVNSKSQHAGLNHDEIQFPGDATYATGGTAGFQTSVRAALGKGNVQILYVVALGNGAQVPIYDVANDKLKIYAGAAEASAGNLSATTFRMIVVSK